MQHLDYLLPGTAPASTPMRQHDNLRLILFQRIHHVGRFAFAGRLNGSRIADSAEFRHFVAIPLERTAHADNLDCRVQNLAVSNNTAGRLAQVVKHLVRRFCHARRRIAFGLGRFGRNLFAQLYFFGWRGFLLSRHANRPHAGLRRMRIGFARQPLIRHAARKYLGLAFGVGAFFGYRAPIRSLITVGSIGNRRGVRR